MVRIGLLAGLTFLGACADKRLGAPGQAPPLQTTTVKGDPYPVAQCTMDNLRAAKECDSIDFGLGLSANAVTQAINLTCYNVTPTAVQAGAAFGLIGVLIGAAVGEKEAADPSNKRPPAYTAVFEQAGAGVVKIGFWVAKSMEGPEYYIDKVKTAMATCDGKMATPTVPAFAPPSVPPMETPAAGKPVS